MAPAYMDFLLKALDELHIDTDTVKGSVDFDPMGQLATTGGFYFSEKSDFDNADKMLLAAVNELTGLRVLAVNSYLFGNAGASAVQELGSASPWPPNTWTDSPKQGTTSPMWHRTSSGTWAWDPAISLKLPG